jgi:hypothetical protein
MIKIGSIGLFQETKDHGGSKIVNIWPAIVYKVSDKGPEAVGCTVFRDGVPTRFGYVYVSKEVSEGEFCAITEG